MVPAEQVQIQGVVVGVMRKSLTLARLTLRATRRNRRPEPVARAHRAQVDASHVAPVALSHLSHLVAPDLDSPMAELKQINFTIVPDDDGRNERTYANFCAISQTPFDCTLTFCEVQPLSEDEIRTLNSVARRRRDGRARAHPRRMVVPFQVLPESRRRAAGTAAQRRRAPRARRPRALRRAVADPRPRSETVAILDRLERQHPGRRHRAALPHAVRAARSRRYCRRSPPTRA